ncbi:MAG: hypothetical protein ABR591_12105 [Candidatus Velthaea sp.]
MTPPPAPVTAAGPPAPAIVGAASGVVRRYVDALIHGDEPVGYSLLGGSAGDRGLTLSEEAFLDTNARITSLRATKVDDSNATVEVEFSSSKGSYYGTYHVTAGPRGPYIVQHEYIKV